MDVNIFSKQEIWLQPTERTLLLQKQYEQCGIAKRGAAFQFASGKSEPVEGSAEEREPMLTIPDNRDYPLGTKNGAPGTPESGKIAIYVIASSLPDAMDCVGHSPQAISRTVFRYMNQDQAERLEQDPSCEWHWTLPL